MLDLGRIRFGSCVIINCPLYFKDLHHTKTSNLWITLWIEDGISSFVFKGFKKRVWRTWGKSGVLGSSSLLPLACGWRCAYSGEWSRHGGHPELGPGQIGFTVASSASVFPVPTLKLQGSYLYPNHSIPPILAMSHCPVLSRSVCALHSLVFLSPLFSYHIIFLRNPIDS